LLERIERSPRRCDVLLADTRTAAESLAVADTRQVIAEAWIAVTCKQAREPHVKAVRSDAVNDAGIRYDDCDAMACSIRCRLCEHAHETAPGSELEYRLGHDTIQSTMAETALTGTRPLQMELSSSQGGASSTNRYCTLDTWLSRSRVLALASWVSRTSTASAAVSGYTAGSISVRRFTSRGDTTRCANSMPVSA